MERKSHHSKRTGSQKRRSRRREFTVPRKEPSFSDILFGDSSDEDEEFHYGLLLTSLNENDARYMHDLKETTSKKLAFKRLTSTEYETSIIPLVSDENPLGEVKAHGVGIFVEDKAWGPDLLEDDISDEPNYFQIIKAAQELGL